MALKSCLHMAAPLVYPTNSEFCCVGAALKFSDPESSEQSRDGLKAFPGSCGFLFPWISVVTCLDNVTRPAQTLSASLCSLQHRALLASLLQKKEQQRCCRLCWERRGQGLNSALGELKYSKHKADVALPRLHVNQRHMLPPLWQHMCNVYLEDPHCHLFLFPPSQDWKKFAPAFHAK